MNGALMTKPKPKITSNRVIIIYKAYINRRLKQ